MKILLVEDDELMSRMYLRIMQAEGFEVATVSSGEKGIVEIETFHPDIIVLDVMMPKMDGLQVLAQLKSKESSAKIPVIMLSNLSTDRIVSDAFAQGANSYLVKSQTSNDALIEEIKKYRVG